MKYQRLCSEKKMENISKCRLLKILLSRQSAKLRTMPTKLSYNGVIFLQGNGILVK